MITFWALLGLLRCQACLTMLCYFHIFIRLQTWRGLWICVHTLAEYQRRTDIEVQKTACALFDMMMNCIWNSHAVISSSPVVVRWGKLWMVNSHSVHSCTNTRVHMNCCTEMRNGKLKKKSICEKKAVSVISSTSITCHQPVQIYFCTESRQSGGIKTPGLFPTSSYPGVHVGNCNSSSCFYVC